MPERGTQYATQRNLSARRRLWQISDRLPAFDFYDWALGVAAVDTDEQMVDVGCGNGAYLQRLPQAVGADLSIGMLTAAQAKVRNPLVAADIEALPFRDGTFDVVLAAHVLYHVLDRTLAAHELRRVLKAGGRCVAVTNSESNQYELVRLVEDVVGHGWRWRRPSDVAFSMDNGEHQLRTAFSNVARIDAPASVFLVRDADALADYVASVSDVYETQVAEWITWPEVVDHCRHRAKNSIALDGAFPISMAFGAFVCRTD